MDEIEVDAAADAEVVAAADADAAAAAAVGCCCCACRTMCPILPKINLIINRFFKEENNMFYCAFICMLKKNKK